MAQQASGKRITWVLRGVIIVVLALIFINFQGKKQPKERQVNCLPDSSEPAEKGTRSSLERAKGIFSCLEKTKGPEQKLLSQEDKAMYHNMLKEMPFTPVGFIGDWVSIRPGCRYKMELHANAEFVASPITCNISSKTFTGSWSVSGDKMVWFPDGKVAWPPDVNVILINKGDSFTLLENDGTQTKFFKADQAPPETD